MIISFYEHWLYMTCLKTNLYHTGFNNCWYLKFKQQSKLGKYQDSGYNVAEIIKHIINNWFIMNFNRYFSNFLLQEAVLWCHSKYVCKNTKICWNMVWAVPLSKLCCYIVLPCQYHRSTPEQMGKKRDTEVNAKTYVFLQIIQSLFY